MLNGVCMLVLILLSALATQAALFRTHHLGQTTLGPDFAAFYTAGHLAADEASFRRILDRREVHADARAPVARLVPGARRQRSG